MNRRCNLLVAAGSALLAIACWQGDSAALVATADGIARCLLAPGAGVAYAAPPSRGSVIRLAPPKAAERDDRIPGIVASDQDPFDSSGSEVRQASEITPRSQRSSTLDHLESSLPDDAPEELIARRPAARRAAPVRNLPFAERPKLSPQGGRTRTSAPQGQRPAATAGQSDSPIVGQPTLADPQQDPASSARRRAAADRSAVDSRGTDESPAPRELPEFEPSPETSVPQEVDELHPVSGAMPDQSAVAPALVEAHPGFQPSEPAGPAIDNIPEPEQPERSASTAAIGPERGVLLRWEAPPELLVETEAECQLVVENTTDSTLTQILVVARLPAGLRLLRTEPATAEMGEELRWQFDALDPRQQQTIHLWVAPTGEGEIEPTATVTFSHAAAARLNVIHPRLQIQTDGPDSVLAGQQVGMRLKVANPGTGQARNVVVELRLDPGLHHPAGSRLEYRLGTLGAGQSREVQVTLSPTEAGTFEIQAAATGEPGLADETSYPLEVLKPTLQVLVEGPKLRYVDRQATYSIKVHNPGPAPADNVQVIDVVPRGFRFVEASSGGTFDPQAGQVAWFVGRLEPNQSTEVNVQLVPTEPGEQRIAAEVKADAGVSETAETITRVEGVASVALDVVDADDPVEVAGETSYEIRLVNRGSQPARGVQAAAKLPAELEAVEATGPTSARIQDRQIVFEPLDELAPGATQVYQVRVRCLRAGQVTFRAYFRDADHPTAVAEEELTRVYQD